MYFKGCQKCLGCYNGPIRGNYDGLVVLAAITKDTLPPTFISDQDLKGDSSKKGIKRPSDHELYALNLEQALVSHFKYSEVEYSARCVWNRRAAFEMEQASNEKMVNGEADSFLSSAFAKRGLEQRTNNRKSHGYVIYVAYRLETHDTQIVSVGQNNPEVEVSDNNIGLFNDMSGLNGDDSENEDHSSEFDETPEEDEKMDENLDEKQLTIRLDSLEEEYKELQEKIKKLDHGRMWIENRLSVLEDPNEYLGNNNVSAAESTNQGGSMKRKFNVSDTSTTIVSVNREQNMSNQKITSNDSPI